MGDSSALGFIAPSGLALYDDALTDILQATIVGITGLPGGLIRPRWQVEPPTQPDFNVDWCAMGITKTTPDTFNYERHDPAANGGLGASYVEEDEVIIQLCSFYGPNSSKNCEVYRKGLMINQNRDALAAYFIYLTAVDEQVNVPALIKEKWVRRADVTVTYRRRTSTTYPILTILGGGVNGLDNGIYNTPILTPVSPPGSAALQIHAAISANPQSGSAPLLIQFQDRSSGGPTSWLWLFGDSTFSTDQNPRHEYAVPGQYTVTLTASNLTSSDSTSITAFINVTAAPPPVNKSGLQLEANAGYILLEGGGRILLES